MPRVRDRRTGRLIAGPTADPAPARWSSPVSGGGGGIPATGVTPGTYGDATHVGQFTVGPDGRLTFAADVAITFPAVDLSDYLFLPGRTGATNNPLISTDDQGVITGSSGPATSGPDPGRGLTLNGNADPTRPTPIIFNDNTTAQVDASTAVATRLMWDNVSFEASKIFVHQIGVSAGGVATWNLTLPGTTEIIALQFDPNIFTPATAAGGVRVATIEAFYGIFAGAGQASTALGQGLSYNPRYSGNTAGGGTMTVESDEAVASGAIYNDEAQVVVRRGLSHRAAGSDGTATILDDVAVDVDDLRTSSATITNAYSMRSVGPLVRLAHAGPVRVGDGTTISPLSFADGTGFDTSFQAQAQAGDIAYTWPAADAVGFLHSDGAGALSWQAAGTGSVTSVGLDLPAEFTITASPITTSGDLTAVWATEAANKVFAGPAAGSPAIPTFRALVAADLPATAVTPASYGSATQVGTFTVDAAGRLTAAANVTVTPAASSITGGQALTKTDDTNVTLTLGGTPSTALLAAASLTLGWTGTLAIARGGTGAGTALAAFNALSPLTTRGDLLTRDAANNARVAIGGLATYLRSDGTDPSWQTIAYADISGTPTSLPPSGAAGGDLTGTYPNPTLAAVISAGGPIGSATVAPIITWDAKGRLTAVSSATITPAASSITGGAALTKTDDTNVTATLGGTPTTALLTAASITLGWTGQLSIARGGTGAATALAAFNALSPLTTRGDMLTRDATNNVRVAIGAAARLWQSDGTDPSWVALSGDATIAAGGAVTLASTISAGGPTGSATVVPVITYDAKGRLTTVTTATIVGPFPPNGSAGGDLSGSYPNPTVAKINGVAYNADPLAQYLLLAGRTGATNDPILSTSTAGTLSGSSASGQPLIVQSTTHATRSTVQVRDPVLLYTGDVAVPTFTEVNALAIDGGFSVAGTLSTFAALRMSGTITATGTSGLAYVFYNQSIFSQTAAGTGWFVYSYRSGPTIRADGVAVTTGDIRGLSHGATYDVVNSGTQTITTDSAVVADAVIGAGTTLTTRRGMLFNEATGAGTLTNQIALDIAALAKGGTLNVGVRSATVAGANNYFLQDTGGAKSELAGKFTKYNNIATLGFGVPAIVDTQSLTGQVADIADTNFANTAVTGLYRIEVYVVDTTAAIGAGAVTVNIKFNDGSAAQTVTVGPVSLVTLGAFAQATIFARRGSGSISYGVTHTGIFSTAAYALHLTCERLV